MGWWEQRPGAMGGKPLITGTRIPVATVWRYLDAGRTTEQIIESFPVLTEAAIEAARDAHDLVRAMRASDSWQAAYDGCYRLIDHHGVLHLTTASMPPSAALCGHPPIGNKWADEAPTLYPPERALGPYDRVCDTCRERA